MAETITFPDVVEAIVPYLSARLTARSKPATVASRIPNPRPPRMVRVTHAGGSRSSLYLARPFVLIECWDSGGDNDSHDLAALCSAELEAATRTGLPMSGVYVAADPDDFSLPVYFPDELTTAPRYQFTAALTVGAITI